MTNSRFVITSKWILPVTGPAILNGALVIDNNHIREVGIRESIISRYSDLPLRDYGEALVVPGFINMHSHLDYSESFDLDCNSSLFDWIPKLMNSVEGWTESDFLRSATFGARLNALSGTTFVVDSSYSGQSANALAATGLKGIVGLELFGLDENSWEKSFDAWLARREQLIENSSPELNAALGNGSIRLTCAPHAPYTVCPPLFAHVRDWSAQHGLPLLVHLAESPDECAWISDRSEVIDRFLMKVMSYRPETELRDMIARITWRGRGDSPVGHLARFDLLNERLVAAHCIQLDEKDIATLSRHAVVVAHCPRSNARLHNGLAPLLALRQAGVKVGLGTDSFASNDDLNLLNDGSFALNIHRAVNPQSTLDSNDILSMMTISAAEALGIADQVGSLEVGKRADLSIWRPWSKGSPRGACEPADRLIRFPTRIEDVFVDGKVVVEGGRLRNN